MMLFVQNDDDDAASDGVIDKFIPASIMYGGHLRIIGPIGLIGIIPIGGPPMGGPIGLIPEEKVQRQKHKKKNLQNNHPLKLN